MLRGLRVPILIRPSSRPAGTPSLPPSASAPTPPSSSPPAVLRSFKFASFSGLFRPRNLNITVTYVPNVQFTTFRHPSPEHLVIIVVGESPGEIPEVSLLTQSSATRARTLDDALMCFDPISPISANNSTTSVKFYSIFVVGIWGIFGIDTDTPIPFSLPLVTNVLLLGLTAGKIWIKRGQATVVLGVHAGRRYGRTLEIICESGLLYFINVLVYLVADVVTQSLGAVTGMAWAALAQVVNKFRPVPSARHVCS
ncbi:hypothetical protein FB451DRAFT_1404127 [Mycena latifolia]|nr:hypothetical protein FB451DRAFT_1404127 [Mycena latifolia]